ncbi:O-methyltransferase family protein [Mycolicibacterium fortuitum]|uniref:O-methyltransferase family protein n=1 Tax=Mycolicibacterium fortuitum TaxID=1766 RepID=A0A378UWB8_MYCFO|nr:O-methyltransferase family protein [Mycolicibacterium fortuitum]
MSDDGVLTTIDVEPEHQRIAKQGFSEAGVGPGRTRLISGRAQEVLTRLADESYDLVFIDAEPIDQPQFVAEGCGCCVPEAPSCCTGPRSAVEPATPRPTMPR